MLATVAPAQESYGCQLFVAPPEGLHINREEVAFSRGGHHVLLYKTPYKEIPSTDERGNPVNAGEVHPCDLGATALWKVDGVIGGSESFGGKGILSELPEGVALSVEPGTVLLMSTHYLNTSAEPLEADSRINLYTIPKEQVRTEAGVLYLEHPFIRVPANGESTARMRCPVSKNIEIVSLQSHMHARGVSFFGDLVDTKTGQSSDVYTTASWKEPEVEEFQPPLAIQAGKVLDFRCDYMNPEARDVRQGLTANDEMCQIMGPYYPRDVNLENCRDENGIPAATWFGSGNADCATTHACIQSAKSFREDNGASIYACIENSCPGAATEVSEVARCYMEQRESRCSAACENDPAGAECGKCLSDQCGEAISACAATTCAQ